MSALPANLLLVVFRAGVQLGRGITTQTHDGTVNALLDAIQRHYLLDDLLLRETLPQGHTAHVHNDAAARQVDLALAELIQQGALDDAA